jgi:hypothetical protein
LYDEMQATGPVLVGRRTAEQADHYKGNHHGVPIVVVSRRPARGPLVVVADHGTGTRRWRLSLAGSAER